MTTSQTRPDLQTLDRILEKTKGRMLFMKQAGISWISSLVLSHKYVWDDEAPTAWCNGTTIGINPDFFVQLPWESRITLLAHEADHTMYDHFDRMKDRNPKVWNIAADYVINNELDNMGFSFVGLEFGCLDHQYDNMTTEQVYDLLMQDPDFVQKCQDMMFPGGTTGDDGQGGAEELPQLCGDMKPTPENEKAARAVIMVNARNAALEANEAGTLSGEATEALEKLLNPVLPWHVLLQRFLNERNQDDYSWRRPNRRYDDIYLPSLLSDNGLEHLLYFFDVSGSVTKAQADRCLTELASLHSSLRPEKITLATFDTKIQDVYDFYKDDLIEQIEIQGRGGTSLEPVYEMIVKDRPTAAIVFTDLDCAPMEDPRIPVIWIVLDSPKATPKFGVTIHLDTTSI